MGSMMPSSAEPHLMACAAVTIASAAVFYSQARNNHLGSVLKNALASGSWLCLVCRLSGNCFIPHGLIPNELQKALSPEAASAFLKICRSGMGQIANAWSRDSQPPRLVKAFASRVTHVSPPQVSAAECLVVRKISFHHSSDHFSQICTLIPVTKPQTRINGEAAGIHFRWPHSGWNASHSGTMLQQEQCNSSKNHP
jgi:hypothetical protein